MATEVFLNIKDLPESTQPNNGDYFLIETATGTQLLNFQNLTIPSANTVITTTVEQNSTAIYTNTTTIGILSTAISDLKLTTSQTSAASLQNTTDIATINTSVNTISSLVTNLVYIGKAQITIPTGNLQASFNLSPTPTKILTTEDIQVTPANAYASTKPVYVDSVINSSVTIVMATAAASNAIYNIAAIKS